MGIKTIGLLLALATFASANPIVIDTNDRGYYYSYDYNLPTNQNYITGQLNTTSTTDVGFHSFFEFNGIPGLSGPIVSATLSLYNPAGGFSSSQSSETLVIDQFTGNTSTLITAGGNPGGGTVTGEYNALASGTVLGTQTVDATSDGTFVTITLNAAGIAFLNANSGNAFAFGGFLSGIPGGDVSSRYEFGGSNFTSPTDGNAYLTVVTATSPEPQTLLFVAPALLGLFLLRRKMATDC